MSADKRWYPPLAKRADNRKKEVQMSNELIEGQPKLMAGVIENVMIRGDLSGLDAEQKINYYRSLCHSLNLNPLTKPFEYLQLGNKLVLYATRSCTDQLRHIHKISVTITKRELTETHYLVTAQGKTVGGRTDEAMGVVTIVGLKGDALANALLKCETKAKRRLTLSIAGLGFLDENEPETVPNAQPISAEDVYNGTAQPLIYTVPFGKFKDRKLEEIPTEELVSYIRYIREKASQGKKDIIGDVKEFLERADSHIEELVLEKELNSGFENAMERE